jgi:hypothetical protein
MDPQTPNLSNPTPETPTAIPESPKKDSHGITIAAMATFVLLALGAIAFLYYQNQQLKNLLAGYQTQPSPTPTATVDSTINWKTYTDPKNKFSFMYPENYNYIMSTSGNLLFFSDSNTYQNCQKYIQQNIRRIDSPCLMDDFNFSGLQILTTDKYQKYFSERENNGDTLDPKTFKDSRDRTWQTYMALGEVFNFTGILVLDNKYYIVDLQSGYDQEKDGGASFRNLANQILSTFSFLNPTVTPSAEPAACTLEAKICPDGSSVGRTGPNCEFAPCPVSY